MGLLIALEYLKYVVSSSRLFSRDLAILENLCMFISICPFMAKSFAISMVFAIYITLTCGCILFNQQPRKPL